MSDREITTLAHASRQDGDEAASLFLVQLGSVRGYRYLGQFWGKLLKSDPVKVWNLNLQFPARGEGALFTDRAAEELAVHYPGKLRELLSTLPQSERASCLADSLGALAADEGLAFAAQEAGELLQSDTPTARNAVQRLIGEGVWHPDGPSQLEQLVREIPNQSLLEYARGILKSELARLGGTP